MQDRPHEKILSTAYPRKRLLNILFSSTDYSFHILLSIARHRQLLLLLYDIHIRSQIGAMIRGEINIA